MTKSEMLWLIRDAQQVSTLKTENHTAAMEEL